MSKRLQVLMGEAEYRRLKRQAARARLSVGEYVRRTLRRAGEEHGRRSPVEKLRSLERSAALSFPTADIDQMLAEIDRGRDFRSG